MADQKLTKEKAAAKTTKGAGAKKEGGTKAGGRTAQAGKASGQKSTQAKKSAQTGRAKKASRRDVKAKESDNKMTREPEEPLSASMKEEIALAVTLLVSVLFFLSYINLCGSVGKWLNTLIFGMVGIFGYLFPFLLFFGAAFFISNRKNRIVRRKLTCSAAFFICFAALIELLSTYDPERSFTQYFTLSAEGKNGGGILGGTLVFLLCPLFDTVATAVILIILMIICLMVVTGRELFAYIRSVTGEGVQERRAALAERRQQSREREEDFDEGYYDEEYYDEEYYDEEYPEEAPQKKRVLIFQKPDADVAQTEKKEPVRFVDALKARGRKGKNAAAEQEPMVFGMQAANAFAMEETGAELTQPFVQDAFAKQQAENTVSVSGSANEAAAAPAPVLAEDAEQKDVQEVAGITITGDYQREDVSFYEEELKRKFGGAKNENTGAERIFYDVNVSEQGTTVKENDVTLIHKDWYGDEEPLIPQQIRESRRKEAGAPQKNSQETAVERKEETDVESKEEAAEFISADMIFAKAGIDPAIHTFRQRAKAGEALIGEESINAPKEFPFAEAKMDTGTPEEKKRTPPFSALHGGARSGGFWPDMSVDEKDNAPFEGIRIAAQDSADAAGTKDFTSSGMPPHSDSASDDVEKPALRESMFWGTPSNDSAETVASGRDADSKNAFAVPGRKNADNEGIFAASNSTDTDTEEMFASPDSEETKGVYDSGNSAENETEGMFDSLYSEENETKGTYDLSNNADVDTVGAFAVPNSTDTDTDTVEASVLQDNTDTDIMGALALPDSEDEDTKGAFSAPGRAAAETRRASAASGRAAAVTAGKAAGASAPSSRPQNAAAVSDLVNTEIFPAALPVPEKKYEFPPIDLLAKPVQGKGTNERELMETAAKLQNTLQSFGVRVTVTNISCGPAVTQYELQPEQGVKVNRITKLSDDIKLNLAATDIRIEAPIPGKAAVGIEVPNKENSPVILRELIESSEFKNHKSRLAFAVGKNISGQIVVSDIAKMPHMLIAGATGSGKSVCINTIIMSILYKADPKDVKLIMVDPKVVELSVYNGIPHLLIPVVTDPKKASAALNWAVAEMTDRYQKFAALSVRDLAGYNEKVANFAEQNPAYPRLPQIVIIVDELADLMMVASANEVEDAICRLAQMARAAGIHLIIATQRPSVNVITGVIKANVPSRVAFAVTSAVDSRTILDGVGAERLLGKGDMLFFPSGYPKPVRIQGAFVSDAEVSAVVDFLKEQAEGMNGYNEEINKRIMSEAGKEGGKMAGSNGNDDYFAEAGRYIIEKQKASIGMLQRVYKIGFNRAARIMDQLTEAGVVGPEEGTKPRKILMTQEEFEEYLGM